MLLLHGQDTTAVNWMSIAGHAINIRNSSSSKVRNKGTRVPTLTTTIQYSFGSPTHGDQRRKRNKESRLERSKTLPVCRWHDIESNKHATKNLLELVCDVTLYIENHKHPIKNLPEVVHEFSEVAKYKINTQKLLAFLYTNIEKSER